MEWQFTWKTLPKRRLSPAKRLAQMGVVGPVVVVQPGHHLGDGQGAVVDDVAGTDQAADQADAALAADTRVHRLRPIPVQQVRIDIVHRAVDVDEGAGKGGRDHGGATLRDVGEKLVDIGVFRPPQNFDWQGRPEVYGRRVAAMGRVEHQRQRPAATTVRCTPGTDATSAVMQPSEPSLAPSP